MERNRTNKVEGEDDAMKYAQVQVLEGALIFVVEAV
jgi:hypothetical protein